MKKGMIFALIVLSVFLIACSKTEVIKIGQNNTAPAKTQQLSANQTKIPAATTNTTGKVAVGCDDTDDDDFTTSGRVTITYNDGSKKDYIDECPGNSNIVTEYICKGNDVSTKLNICKQLCVAGICIE